MQTATDQLFNYDVVTSDNHKVGSVDGVWVDDATNDLEFVAVKTGWLMGKNHIIPTGNAQIDSNSGTITVPYSSDQVRGAPSFASDQELSPSDEQQVYDYYGRGRETQTSPTGRAPASTAAYDAGTYATTHVSSYADRDAATDTMSTNASDLPTPPTDVDLALSQEELEVGKRQVQAGEVRLRKVVRTEHQNVPVELRREEVQIERVDASEATTNPDNAFQEQTITIPIMEERPVVAKETHVVGGVRVTKDVTSETRTVEGDVRTEDVEIDGNTDQVDTGITRSYHS